MLITKTLFRKIAPLLLVRLIFPLLIVFATISFSCTKEVSIFPNFKFAPEILISLLLVLIISAIFIWKLPVSFSSTSAVNVILPLPWEKFKLLLLKGLMLISFVAWNMRFVFPDKPSKVVLLIVALSSSPIVIFLVSSNNVPVSIFSLTFNFSAPVNWTIPPGAVNILVLMTFAPNKVRFSPSSTFKLPSFLITACWFFKALTNNTPGWTESKLLLWGFVALNKPFSPNLMLSAVVAVKEPRISKLAPAPKYIPLGLIKNKFAVPSTPNFPKILETFPPVTRVNIFSIPVGLAK